MTCLCFTGCDCDKKRCCLMNALLPSEHIFWSVQTFSGCDRPQHALRDRGTHTQSRNSLRRNKRWTPWNAGHHVTSGFGFWDFICGLIAALVLWVMKLLEGSSVAVIAAIAPGMWWGVDIWGSCDGWRVCMLTHTHTYTHTPCILLGQA